jgi:uncharacterized protein involved in response to NO
VLGFLTTALPNFAGATPLTGQPLAVLAAVWLAGRVALWAADPAATSAGRRRRPRLVAAGARAVALAAAFVPTGACSSSALFAIFAAANALTHAEALG